MIQTKYLCDLCGEEIQAEKSGNEVKTNITLTFHNHSDLAFHCCETCVTAWNPYEIVAKLFKKINHAPPYQSHTHAIKITLPKLKPVLDPHKKQET